MDLAVIIVTQVVNWPLAALVARRAAGGRTPLASWATVALLVGGAVAAWDPASTLMFSGAHLHSTVPNTSGRTRFSIDFRTINLSDLVNRVGAVEIDDGSTGTTARDFLRLTDRSQLPEDVVALYDVGSTHSGPLVFDPSVVS